MCYKTLLRPFLYFSCIWGELSVNEQFFINNVNEFRMDSRSPGNEIQLDLRSLYFEIFNAYIPNVKASYHRKLAINL